MASHPGNDRPVAGETIGPTRRTVGARPAATGSARDLERRDGNGTPRCAQERVGARGEVPQREARIPVRGEPRGHLVETVDQADEVVLTLAVAGDEHLEVGEEVAEGAATLDTTDLPIIAMLMDRTPAAEIAEVLGLEQQELDRRVDAMLGRLGVRTGHRRARV
jgi:hypothetical protein